MANHSRNVWNVLKFEFLSLVKRRSFILSLILVPVIPLLILGGLKLLQGGDSTSIQEMIAEERNNPLPYGIVDESGMVKTYPEWVEGRFVAIASENEARQQTADGKLQGFYQISRNYIETGEITLVKPEVNMVSELAETGLLEELVKFNLIGGDEALYKKMANPMTVEIKYLDLEKADTRNQENAATYWVPFAIGMFFYVLIIVSSSQMLSSISKEKENRTMEVLLSSVKPLDLFLGKVLARGLSTLVQVAVWLGTLMLVAFLSKKTFTLPFDLNLPATLYIFGLPFFATGFLLFGSLLSGIGAMAQNTREGGQYSMIVNAPLIVAYLSVNQIINAPTSPLTTFLSFFPLTSPVIMPTRLTIGTVPVWHLIVSLLILAATTYFTMRGVANLFRSQTLLSGDKFNVKSFFKTLFFGKSA